MRAASTTLQNAVATGAIAGGSLLVRRRGAVAELVYDGYADKSDERRTGPGTLFRLASMTKPIIAVAILQLVENRSLRLSDPVSNLIPAFEQQSQQWMAGTSGPERITIEDLLRHRSGLGQGDLSLAAISNAYRTQGSLEDRVNAFAAIPADYPPGYDCSYSPLVGFDVLGRIIEIVTDTDLEQALRDTIFAPLGMVDTTFQLNEGQRTRAAVLYEGHGADAHPVDDTNELVDLLDPVRGYSGAAGLWGTLEDYDRFVQMLVNRGEYQGNKLLSPSGVLSLASVGSETTKFSGGFAWGLGVIVSDGTLPRRRRGTWGWSGSFGTHFYIDPMLEESVVLMINQADIGGADSPISSALEQELA